MKRVLMVAYHFPPLAGSSGIQRTLRFVQHLPSLGWEPLVLTAHPRAYEATSRDLLADVPPGVVVERAFALDTARHLAVFRRYPGFLARPDRWLTWKWGGVRAGLRLIEKYRPDAIWSTYPIATAHLIGAELHRRTKLPWIADFRDPMAQDDYPPDPDVWRSFKRVEEHAVHNAAYSVFVTPSAARTYRERYPDVDPSRIVLIENGFDEESFAAAERSADGAGPIHRDKVTLVHSGIVYPNERDPRHLFAALRALKRARSEAADRLAVRFRAPVHDDFVRGLADAADLRDVVEVMPPIPYREALQEMRRADGLLVLQASNCNQQVPAKVYEYLRAGRPMLALTDALGDTAAVLRGMGVTDIAPLDGADEIGRVLERFVGGLRRGDASQPSPANVARASRAARTRELVQLLEQAV